MAADLLDRYAEVVVRIGLNVQPGQVMRVAADLSHAPVARAVVEAAYVAGASRVTVDYADSLVRRSTLKHAPMETLTGHEGWQLERLREWGREGAALLTLTGNPDPHVFDGARPGARRRGAGRAGPREPPGDPRRRGQVHRRGAQPRLGAAGVRRARRGPAVGGSVGRDAAGRPRRRGGVARAP